MMSKVALRNSSETPVGLWSVIDKYYVIPAMRAGVVLIEEELTMQAESTVLSLAQVGTMEILPWMAPAFEYTPKLSNTAPQSGVSIMLDTGKPSAGSAIAINWFADGAKIEGEERVGFKPLEEHIGKKIKASVTASNEFGSTQETTTETDPVIDGGFPKNTQRPVIVSGEPVVGSTLVQSEGEWSTPSIITFAWQSAKKLTGPWYYIEGASEAGYTIKDSDVGFYIKGVNRAQKTPKSPFATAGTENVGPVRSGA